MSTLAESFFATTPVGATAVLPSAGTWMENDYVYDSSAREIKARAAAGQAVIVDERQKQAGDANVIVHLAFKRLR